MKWTSSTLLNIDNIPTKARKAHLHPNLKYKSLLSVGQMCNTGLVAVFCCNKVDIVNNKDVIVTVPAFISGDRNQHILFVEDWHQQKQ